MKLKPVTSFIIHQLYVLMILKLKKRYILKNLFRYVSGTNHKYQIDYHLVIFFFGYVFIISCQICENGDRRSNHLFYYLRAMFII